MPRPEPVTPVIRATVAQRSRIPSALLVLAAIGFAGALTSAEAASSPLFSLALGLTIGAVLLFATSTRVRLELTFDELVIGSLFSSGRVRWSAIDAIEVAQVMGGRGITLTTNGRLTRLRVPRAGSGPWRDPDFDDKAAQILAAWDRGRRDGRSGRKERR